MPVLPTPDGTKVRYRSCATRKRDHINGTTITIFIVAAILRCCCPLANESTTGELSQSNFVKKHPDGQEQIFCTAPQYLVIFEGARVLHKASPTAEGDCGSC